MNLELKEKIFLVTGASRGIEQAIAKGLLQEGPGGESGGLRFC